MSNRCYAYICALAIVVPHDLGSRGVRRLPQTLLSRGTLRATHLV
jgi:hypothetical protein